MATSAFKSTTKRPSIGASTSEDSAHRSLRRSRSIAPEMDYIKNVPRGKFVNTTRGTTAPFPEISLDDLALEFFSSSSKNESDGGAVDRSASRLGEIGPWANDTASSRRRGRSVSRGRGDAVSTSSAASGTKNAVSSDGSSRRRRSVSVTRNRGNAVPKTDKDAVAADAGTRRRRSLSVARGSGNAVPTGDKDSVAADAGTRRRRSLSVARYQISDSESDIDRSRNSSNRATMIAPNGGNTSKTTASSYRRLGRSRSQIDLSLIHDGYSSQSSALTDDELKDTHFGSNGFQKIIRAVHAPKKVMERNQTAVVSNESNDCSLSENSNTLQNSFSIREKFAQKMVQLEKRKKNLLTEMLLEEQCGGEVSETYELPNSRASAVTEKLPRARKRSSDKSRMSERLIEDAERHFEDFISNIEDTDISSFDGERSDGSSTLGGMVKGREFRIGEAETCRTPAPAGSTSRPGEMDGVILPWLQWETSHDGSLGGKTKVQTPMTPQAVQRDSEKDPSQLHDASSYSMSSHGSWSPGLVHSSPMDKREEVYPTKTGNDCVSKFDMDEYLNLQNNEEILFEMYRKRNRIGLGGLLLCIGVP